MTTTDTINKKKKGRITIRISIKILIAFVIIGFFPLIILDISNQKSIEESISHEIKSKVTLLAESQEGQVFIYLAGLKRQMESFASDGAIKENLEILYDMHTKGVDQTSLQYRAVSDELNNHLLLNKKSLDVNIASIFVLNNEGVVVAATDEEEGDDESSSEHFIQGSKGTVVTLSTEEEEEYEDFRNAVIVTSPIYKNETGEFLGVISSIYVSEELETILSGEFQKNQGALTSFKGRTESLESYLIQKDKEVFVFSESMHINGLSHHDTLVVDTFPVRKCLEEGEEVFGEIYTNYNGEEVVGAAMCIKELGWVLLVESSLQTVSESLIVARTQSNFTVAITSLIMLFGIFIFSILLSRPITRLTKAARKISQGNFATRTSIRSGDEVGELGDAFNNMAETLEKNQVDIVKNLEESRIAEDRTAKQNKDLQKTEGAMLNLLEDIESEKEKAETILESIGDGVFVIDRNQNILVFNNISEQLSGFSAKEAIGKPYHEILHFIHENDGTLNDTFIKEVFRTGETQEMANHTELVHKDGSKVAVADSAAPLKDNDGDITGVVVVFRNVEKERDIDKAKTEFVSLASHQLRTPLSSINWYAEMLLSGDAGELNPEQKDFVDEMYQGNQRMVSLVDSLLSVSRIELGTFSVDPEPTNFKEVAQSIVKELTPSIKEKELVLEEDYGDDVPLILADPKLVRIIFQNFLSNAVKYTPEKGTINLELSKKESDVFIRVSDSGYGIPKDQQSKIFSKLFRADNVRVKDTEGTGLGLYIVEAIVKNAGGKIWFESEEDKGTTFYVTLPLSGMKSKEGI